MTHIKSLALGALLASTSLATAQSFNDQIISDLQGKGYDFIEIKTAPTQVKVEAIRGTDKLEVIYDRATGQILKQEQERAEADEIGRVGVEIDRRRDDFLDDDDFDDEDDDDDDDDRDDDDDDDDDDDRDDDDYDDDHDDDDDDDDDDDEDDDSDDDDDDDDDDKDDD